MISSAFLGDYNYVFWPTDAVPRVLIFGAATYAPPLGGGDCVSIKIGSRAFDGGALLSVERLMPKAPGKDGDRGTIRGEDASTPLNEIASTTPLSN